MPSARFNEANLITPDEALAKISAYVGSEFHAKQVIADGLHAGDVIAYPSRALQKEGGAATDGWERLVAGGQEAECDDGISPSLWTTSCEWPEETRHWDWDAGNFIIQMTRDDEARPIRVLLENVRLKRSEVTALVGRSDRAGAGGPKADRERWAQFWINILYDFTSETEDWTRFDNERQLKQAMILASGVLDHNAKGFSDNNIDFAVKMAWNGLVKRAAAERLARSKRVSDE